MNSWTERKPTKKLSKNWSLPEPSPKSSPNKISRPCTKLKILILLNCTFQKRKCSNHKKMPVKAKSKALLRPAQSSKEPESEWVIFKTPLINEKLMSWKTAIFHCSKEKLKSKKAEKTAKCLNTGFETSRNWWEKIGDRRRSKKTWMASDTRMSWWERNAIFWETSTCNMHKASMRQNSERWEKIWPY